MLRRLQSMSQEAAEKYAELVKPLAWKARSVVRDLDFKVLTPKRISIIKIFAY